MVNDIGDPGKKGFEHGVRVSDTIGIFLGPLLIDIEVVDDSMSAQCAIYCADINVTLALAVPQSGGEVVIHVGWYYARDAV